MATFSIAPPRAVWLLCPVDGAWGPEAACSGPSQFGDLRLYESMDKMSSCTLGPVTQRSIRSTGLFLLPPHPKPVKVRPRLLSVIDVLMLEPRKAGDKCVCTGQAAASAVSLTSTSFPGLRA